MVADVRELLASRSVCESVAQIWKLVPKNMHNSINRVDFHNIVSCIAKVLLVGFDDGELFDLVQKEWDSVAGFHSERMHCISFARCLVQLAVLWLDDNGKNSSNVARFIDSLAVSISVLEITKRDNSVVRVAPSIRQTHFLGHVSERVTFDYQPEQGDDIRRKLASFSEVLPVARLRMYVHHHDHNSRGKSAPPAHEPLAFERQSTVEDDPSNRSSNLQLADGHSPSRENQDHALRDSRVIEGTTKMTITEASPSTTIKAAVNVDDRSHDDTPGCQSLLSPPAGFADALLSQKDLMLDVGKARERWARLRMSRHFLGMWKTFTKGQHVFDLGSDAQDIRFSTLSGLLAKRKIHIIEARKTQSTGHTSTFDNANRNKPATGAAAGHKAERAIPSGKPADHHRQSSDAVPLAMLSQQLIGKEEKVNTPTASHNTDYDFEFRDGTLVPAVKASSSRSRLFAPSTATRHHLPPAVLSAVNEAIIVVDAGDSFKMAPVDAALASRAAISDGASHGKKHQSARPSSGSTLSKPKLAWATRVRAHSTGLPWAGSANDPENIVRTLDAPILRQVTKSMVPTLLPLSHFAISKKIKSRARLR